MEFTELFSLNDLNSLRHKFIRISRTKGESEEYPWGYHEQEAYVDEVYPNFLLLTITSHEHPGGFGPSATYQTTISKRDIITRHTPDPAGNDVFKIRLA